MADLLQNGLVGSPCSTRDSQESSPTTTVQKHKFFGAQLDSILKSRDITLPTKVHLVKAMVFPEVMYGCESCTIKLSTKELMLLNYDIGEDS